jgi:hypothetical protein
LSIGFDPPPLTLVRAALAANARPVAIQPSPQLVEAYSPASTRPVQLARLERIKKNFDIPLVLNLNFDRRSQHL